MLADSGQAQESQVAVAAGSAAPGLALGWVLLMALAGGLILNVMPCVLPVLAMKLGSLVQTEGRERGAVRRQFLASVFGIVVSFLALALMMTALRLGNQALGWGIQFQNPWFIGAMALVMVLFSASLLGLFEHPPILQRQHLPRHPRRQRLNGPFLAGRLRHPAGDALHRAVPRHRRVGGAGGAPAAAVGHFLRHGDRHEPAVAADRCLAGSGATTATPGPLDESSAGGAGANDAWFSAMAGQPADDPHRPYAGAYPAGDAGHRPASGHRLALPLADGAARGRPGHRGGGRRRLCCPTGDGQGPRRDRVNWQPLSEQAIASALAEHKRVFIDVTADWCVTCKANKYNVLLRDDVQQALLAPDVIALRGDWSRPSADISQFLTARGSAAVPFNQIYGPELPQGQILPALLDREHLLATLSAAKGK